LHLQSQIAAMNPLSQLTLAPARELLSHWRRLCPPGGLPLRTNVCLPDIPHLVGNLISHEPVDGGADWRIRLIGSAVTGRYGFDATGMLISEIFGREALPALCADYRRAIAARSPSIMLMRNNLVDRDGKVHDREHVLVERVLLPILGRDGVTPWLLIGVFFRN
jgi:hypothetical protein